MGGPYHFKDNDLNRLYTRDLKDILDDNPVDIWFWGHHHYCGLFDRGDKTPFIGSGIGHGGYPYYKKERSHSDNSLVKWLEDSARFPEWTGHRQDMGNNGFCELTLLHGGGLILKYIDWMRNLRCEVKLVKSTNKFLVIDDLMSYTLPGRQETIDRFKKP